MIDFDDFAKLEIRAATVTAAEPLEEARVPAIVLTLDFGEGDVRRSSAQIAERYHPDDLVGSQVLAVTNLPPKQVGSVMSRCLVLGVPTPEGVVLVRPDEAVPNGARLA